jgi:hypothetical protein
MAGTLFRFAGTFRPWFTNWFVVGISELSLVERTATRDHTLPLPSPHEQEKRPNARRPRPLPLASMSVAVFPVQRLIREGHRLHPR